VKNYRNSRENCNYKKKEISCRNSKESAIDRKCNEEIK
jgi:hypothetical protein